MRLWTRLARESRRLAGVVTIASASLAGVAMAAEPQKGLVKDPHFGDSLFHFYQEHYFSSLTNLMVSQHFSRMPQHADEAEVLRGGLLLSYGLHREAGEIFAQLIEQGASPAVRDRAWFYLAKIRYQRGFIAEAQAAIGRVGKNLPSDLEEERALLQANLLMARGDYAGAVAVLDGLAASSGAQLYARYNLGIALVRSGASERGAALLDEVGKSPATNEEYRALRDKANVALGFTALQDERPEAARGFLERVRLSSMLANKALLGFGWSAAALKQPRQALVPWTELSNRDSSDAAVLESRIAVAYAYAELGAFGQSLERYNDAITAFDRENTALDESITAIRAGRLLDGLLERNPGEEMGWFWNIQQLPAMPHAGHLTHVLAQHEFQEAFKNYRDLKFLATNLQGWAEKLDVFDDMLANRRLAYTERLPRIRAQASDSRLADLSVRGALLAAELTSAEADSDALAFADPKERELLVRLEGVQATLKQLGSDPAYAGAAERARLAAGALTWRMAQAYPARLWEARKALKATDEALTEARGHDAALAQAQRDEPARHEQFAARIAGLDQRIRALTPRVAALIREQQGQVQELAVAELSRQKERLAVYATQARFAVAQLYDRAAMARDVDHARKQ
jgi:Tetratricopeptide repeat